MVYMGIDSGKNHHEIDEVNAEGKNLGKTLRFANTIEDFIKITNKMGLHNPGYSIRIV